MWLRQCLLGHHDRASTLQVSADQLLTSLPSVFVKFPCFDVLRRARQQWLWARHKDRSQGTQ